MGKQINTMLTPHPANKRKPKWLVRDEQQQQQHEQQQQQHAQQQQAQVSDGVGTTAS